MKYYLIEWENGEFRHGYFTSYNEAVNYADSVMDFIDYTISEYDSEEDYFKTFH